MPKWKDLVRLRQETRRAMSGDFVEELPDGLCRDAEGRLWADCRSCGCRYLWDLDPGEFDERMSYCNGSPRCVP